MGPNGERFDRGTATGDAPVGRVGRATVRSSPGTRARRTATRPRRPSAPSSAPGRLSASLFGRLGAAVRGLLPGGSPAAVDTDAGAPGEADDRTEPGPAGDVRWAFAVVGDATHLSDQLDEALDVVAGALEATGDVFRPGEFAWALAGYRGDGDVDRAFPSHDSFRQPAGTVELEREAPREPTAKWLAETTRGVPLAGDVRACLRCDVTGEARVDGGWRPDALSVTVKPAPAPATFPGDAAYRLRIVGDGRAWLAGDPDDRRRLARTFAAVRDRFPVANATTDGGERAAALLE